MQAPMVCGPLFHTPLDRDPAEVSFIGGWLSVLATIEVIIRIPGQCAHWWSMICNIPFGY